MKVETDNVIRVKLTELQKDYRLDPVTLFVEDFGPGKGRITIECFGQSWSFWPAMGPFSIAQFFCRADNHYLAKNLSRIPETVEDYEGLVKHAKEVLLFIRRGKEKTKEAARELWEDLDQMDTECLLIHSTDGDTFHSILGDEWWYEIPTKTNPDYDYLMRILNATRDGLNAAGLNV